MAEAQLRAHALLGEVLSFAGDVRDGRRERRWNDAEPEYLGPIELVNLLSYTFGYHMATGHQSLSLPSDAVAARVATAEWEHSLDYFWDFHGPNPNPTTGYQADY